MAETYHPRGLLIDGYAPRDHPLYNTWATMKSRCNNPNQSAYENYGGRGITYCDRWRDFANFAEDMGPEKPFPEATIERKDNAKGYSPDNCVWATRTEQCLNRRQFKNNSTGRTGITKDGSGYNARFDCQGVRYNLGNFNTIDEAHDARERFVTLFNAGDIKAYELIKADKRDPRTKGERALRRDSSTGVRGITRTGKGGFIVRKTVNGERLYLGHATTFNEAVTLLRGHDDG